ncbi:flavin-containing monooxygenase [Seiridium cupressi]
MNGSSGAKRLNSPALSSDSVANSRNTLSTFKKYGRDLSILNEPVVSRADVLVEPHDMGDMRVQNSERVDVGRRVWSFPFSELRSISSRNALHQSSCIPSVPSVVKLIAVVDVIIARGLISPASSKSRASLVHFPCLPDILDTMSVPPGVEYPQKADLHKNVYRPLPRIAPGTVNPAAMSSEAARLRGIAGTVEFSGNAHFAVMGPTMAFANVEMFIDWRNSFQTNSPALGCSGKLFLLPVKSEGNGPVLRKIWVLSTWIETLSEQTEDETVLSSPNKSLVANTVNNDAFMAGAGSFGLDVAAHLKALGVDSIVVDRNEHIGDNWTRRPGYRNARILAEQEVECVIPDFHYGTSA